MVSDRRRFSFVGLDLWALHTLHGVAGDGIALAQVLKERRQGCQLPSDGGSLDSTLFQLLAPQERAIEEARQQMEAEKAEAAAFADQLNHEPETSKGKAGELAAALDATGGKVTALQTERDQERARADRLQAVGDERQKMVDALKEELVQVRKDKDAEIARLLAPKAQKPGG